MRDVALGQKRTCAAQKVMSALPLKADMCDAETNAAKCQYYIQRLLGSSPEFRGTQQCGAR